MHSRSHILINRELKKIQSRPPWGINITTRNSIFKWDVAINGLKNSKWEDSELNLRIDFTEYFNDACPDIYFHTIPFHPNIDPKTGRPCMDCMGDNWTSQINLESILVSIQYLLSNPETNEVLNHDAAYLYANNRLQYDSIVDKCTMASKVATPVVPVISYKETVVVKNQKVSFENYHASWRQLATSTVKSEPIASDNYNFEKMFYMSETQISDKFKTPSSPAKRDTIAQNKIKKMNKKKNIYLEARNSPRKLKRDDEISELLQWTQELNEDDI